jgi:hypothetical protein
MNNFEEEKGHSEISKEEFNNWYQTNGHWINKEDIEKYGLIASEDEEGEKNSYYRCRSDGSCSGHTEYTHPKYGGVFHLPEDCSVQN